MARLIAPRPMLIGSANRDGIFHIRSIRESFAGVKKIYDHLGAGENTLLIETPGGHSYHANSRRGIFSWFLRHLEQKEVSPEAVGDIDDSPAAQEDAATLRVYQNGVPTAERVTTIHEDFFTLPELPSIAAADQLADARDKTRTALAETSFGHFPSVPSALDAEVEYETGRGDAVAGGRFAFTSEGGWRLHGSWTLPESDSDAPVVVALRSPHERRRATEDWLQGLDSSWARVVAEPRGTGDNAWGTELDWHVRRAAMLTGRTIASMQVYDTLRALEAIARLPGVVSTRVALAGARPNGRGRALRGAASRQCPSAYSERFAGVPVGALQSGRHRHRQRDSLRAPARRPAPSRRSALAHGIGLPRPPPRHLRLDRRSL